MYFLALSQAPPPVVIEIATNRPVTIVPINRPPSACEPAAGPPSHLNPNLTTTGTSTGRKDGMIISLLADLVRMSTALSYLRLPVPYMLQGMSRTLMRTSPHTPPRTRPTAHI